MLYILASFIDRQQSKADVLNIPVDIYVCTHVFKLHRGRKCSSCGNCVEI